MTENLVPKIFPYFIRFNAWLCLLLSYLLTWYTFSNNNYYGLFSTCTAGGDCQSIDWNLKTDNYFFATAVVPRILIIVATILCGLGLGAGIAAWNILDPKQSGILACFNGWAEIVGAVFFLAGFLLHLVSAGKEIGRGGHVASGSVVSVISMIGFGVCGIYSLLFCWCYQPRVVNVTESYY